MKYYFNRIIFLSLISISICEWSSPCEQRLNPESFHDCIGRSTEYVHEVCCYLKGIQNNTESSECVDIVRDDTRSELDINITKKNIESGEYWDKYDLEYESVEILKCNCNYIFPKFLLLYLLILYI